MRRRIGFLVPNGASSSSLSQSDLLVRKPGLYNKSAMKIERVSLLRIGMHVFGAAAVFVVFFLEATTKSSNTYEEAWRRQLYSENGLPIDHVPVMNPSEYTMVEGSPAFDIPRLERADVSPLFFSSDGTQVDPDALLIGLPPQLTDEIRAFCQEIGLMDLFKRIATSSALDCGDSVIVEPGVLKNGHNWAITRAEFGERQEDADLHWVDVIDEASFEKTIEVLKRGNFDDVLNAIAEKFEPEGYMIAGMGFMVATHSVGSTIHSDNPDGGRNFFNLVIPIVLPEHYVAQLYMGNDDLMKVAPLTFKYGVGVLVGADTKHGTADCDYRRDGDMRVFASIYIADIDEDNVDIIAEDGTALFPVPGETDWLLAQRGRFWGGPNNDGSLEMDLGRKPFTATDELENCPELAAQGLCESDDSEDLWEIRLKCLKSCKVYVDDEEYFSTFFTAPTT